MSHYVDDARRLEEACQGGSYESPDFAMGLRLALRSAQLDRADVPPDVNLRTLVFDTDLRGLARVGGSTA